MSGDLPKPHLFFLAIHAGCDSHCKSWLRTREWCCKACANLVEKDKKDKKDKRTKGQNVVKLHKISDFYKSNKELSYVLLSFLSFCPFCPFVSYPPFCPFVLSCFCLVFPFVSFIPFAPSCTLRTLILCFACPYPKGLCIVILRLTHRCFYNRVTTARPNVMSVSTGNVSTQLFCCFICAGNVLSVCIKYCKVCASNDVKWVSIIMQSGHPK